MNVQIKRIVILITVFILVVTLGIFDGGSISYKTFEITKDKNLIIYGNVTGWPYERAKSSVGQFYSIGASLDVCKGSFCQSKFADGEYYNNEIVIEHSLVKDKQMTYKFTFACSSFSKSIDISSKTENDLVAKIKITKFPTIFFNTEVSADLPIDLLMHCKV